jgi:hypothetical protein
MCGLFDDLHEMFEEMDSPGIESGIDGGNNGDVGGGVTDADRCIVVIWMAGRACHKDNVLPAVGIGGSELMLA